MPFQYLCCLNTKQRSIESNEKLVVFAIGVCKCVCVFSVVYDFISLQIRELTALQQHQQQQQQPQTGAQIHYIVIIKYFAPVRFVA